MTRRSTHLLETTAAGAAAAGPFAGLLALPAGAHQPPQGRRAAADPGPPRRRVRLHLPRVSNTAPSTTPNAPRPWTTTPHCPDGTTAWARSRDPNGTVILVRNHEVAGPGAAFGPGTPYDPMARGGTTTIQATPDGEVVCAFTSLNGTIRTAPAVRCRGVGG